MIHVCFGLYDKTGRYSKFTGTTMCSIFENTNTNVTIHIMHDNTLSTDNRDKFSYLAGRYGQIIQFYNVEKLCTNKIEKIKEGFLERLSKRYFSIGAFYRLCIPNVLPEDIEKVIYLDSDIIVNLDINEFWSVELGDKPVGVITEKVNGMNSKSVFALCREGIVKDEDYFNSGVLLMNLKIFRAEEEKIMNSVKFISDRSGYFDQDVLNYCFAARALKLPIKYNRFVWVIRQTKNPIVEENIYHMVNLSCQLDMNDPFNKLWMNYFLKTPFFDVDTIGNIYKEIQKLHDDLKGMAISISASVTGKNRAFFIEPQKFEWLKKIFSAHDDEIFLPAENKEESIVKLLDEMRSRKGKTVFFIMTVKHMGRGFPFDRLTKEGFVEGVDFVKGWLMFSGVHGVGYNSHPLVKAM